MTKNSSPKIKHDTDPDKFRDFAATHRVNKAALALATGLALAGCNLNIDTDKPNGEASQPVPAEVRTKAAQITDQLHAYKHLDGLKMTDVLTVKRVDGVVTISKGNEKPDVLDHPIVLDSSNSDDLEGRWVGEWQLEPGEEGKGAQIVLEPTYLSPSDDIMRPSGDGIVVEDTIFMLKLGAEDTRPADQAREQLFMGNPGDLVGSERIFPAIS